MLLHSTYHDSISLTRLDQLTSVRLISIRLLSSPHTLSLNLLYIYLVHDFYSIDPISIAIDVNNLSLSIKNP